MLNLVLMKHRLSRGKRAFFTCHLWAIAARARPKWVHGAVNGLASSEIPSPGWFISRSGRLARAFDHPRRLLVKWQHCLCRPRPCQWHSLCFSGHMQVFDPLPIAPTHWHLRARAHGNAPREEVLVRGARSEPHLCSLLLVFCLFSRILQCLPVLTDRTRPVDGAGQVTLWGIHWHLPPIALLTSSSQVTTRCARALPPLCAFAFAAQWTIPELTFRFISSFSYLFHERPNLKFNLKNVLISEPDKTVSSEPCISNIIKHK